MDKYKAIKVIGGGTFGSVWRAVNKHCGEVVAIKVLKKRYSSWEECLNLREVMCLRKLNHSNIVRLKELIRENDILYFVFEHMECNLYELIASRKQQFFSEAEVRKWCFQVFQGLNYTHRHGYFHRDLKPENLLVTKDIIKIADFGQAREINLGPPYTVNISTLWYRAPELLLHSSTYTSKVDMWAMGAIMAELITLRPLFPGDTEAHQIYKICNVIGSPTKDSWAEGLYQARSLNYKFPQLAGINLSSLMPSASENVISLIRSLCSWDPCKRPTAAEALQHPFFRNCFYVPPPLRSKATVTGINPSAVTSGMLQQQGARMHSGALHDSRRDSNFSSQDLSTDVQHNSAKQQKYSPAPGRTAHGVSKRQSVALLKLPTMKTGVQWNAESGDLYLRPVQHLEPGRIYNRKVG